MTVLSVSALLHYGKKSDTLPNYTDNLLNELTYALHFIFVSDI